MSYRDLDPGLARVIQQLEDDIESLKQADGLDGPVTLGLPLRLYSDAHQETILIDLVRDTSGAYHLTAVLDGSADNPTDIWSNS